MPACRSGAPRRPRPEDRSMSASSRRSRGWSRAHAERLLWRAGFGATPDGDRLLGAALARARRSTGSSAAARGPHGHRGAWSARRRAPTASRWTRSTSGATTCCGGWTGWSAASARCSREAHALLARPLRHARPGRAAHAGPEPQAAQPRAGVLPALLRRGDDRPGDAGLPLAGRLRQARTPTRTTRASCMELFTLGAGSGYTERDVREAARALTGFRGHWPDGRPLPSSLRPPSAARRRRQAAARPPRALRLAGRPATSSSAIRATPPSSSASCGTSSSPSRCRGDPPAPGADLRALAPPHRARRARDPRAAARSTPTSTTRGWSSAPIVLDGRASCAWSGARSTPTTGPGSAIEMGQMPFHPPSVAGWDWGAGVDVDRHHARALPGATWMTARTARQGGQGRGATRRGRRPSTSPRARAPPGGRGRRATTDRELLAHGAATS